MTPSILAALYRSALGIAPIEPDPGLGHAATYLYETTGVPRRAKRVRRAVEQYMILTVDHGFNASTFTARVVASTGADVADAVCAAIGALAGPLHGGAPSRALDALDAIGTPDRAPDWVRGEVAAGRRIMGFGHAVYRAPDPRSGLLREVAEQLGGELVERADRHRGRDPGDARRTEARSSAAEQRRVLRRCGDGDCRAAAGRCSPRRSPSAARSAGRGHIVEQAAVGKLIRPTSRYTGPTPNFASPDPTVAAGPRTNRVAGAVTGLPVDSLGCPTP